MRTPLHMKIYYIMYAIMSGYTIAIDYIKNNYTIINVLMNLILYYFSIKSVMLRSPICLVSLDCFYYAFLYLNWKKGSILAF